LIMTRNLLSLWIVVAVLGLLMSPAYAQLLPLTGEQLASTSAQGSIVCVNNQQSGTLTFSGVAIGPYPGTFTERITLTPISSGLVDVKIDFTITSGDVTITGEKHEPRALPCDSRTYALGTVMTYTATISGPSGTLEDAGFAHTGWAVLLGNATAANETFASRVAGEPATVELSPPTDINPVGSSHTVTATVEDILGEPMAEVEVLFEVEGSSTTTGSCVTDVNGQCSFTYTGPSEPGADRIAAVADVIDNGRPDPNEPFGNATKAWGFSTPPAGSVTGGGQAGVAPVITFGFNARNDPKVSGNCTIVDQSTDPRTIIKCATVTSVTVVSPNGGGTAHIEATGTIDTGDDKIQTNIRIDVTDVSEPNRGADSFLISTTSGYTAGGAVTSGNIQVHR
jgi:hypothetical protein